jgi:cellulose synthase/poly-beta-1,6-N-acetylglucosamine synthase-like glycosyltransferase
MGMKLSRGLMWGSAGLIAWTQVGYPLAAAALARRRRYAPRRDEGFTPDVALIIAAHNEEGAIEAQLENVLRLDYPEDRLEVLVALDGSADGTRAAVERVANERVRVLDLPRAGKVSAQNAGVRSTSAEVLAFSDAHSPWERGSLRQLVRNFADPEVGYVCGKVELDGETDEGLYWSFETWLREHESACGSLTAGSGAIYAVRRAAFVELGPEHSHDIALPFRLRRNGFRSVFEPAAVAREPGRSSSADEWPRKVRPAARARLRREPCARGTRPRRARAPVPPARVRRARRRRLASGTGPARTRGVVLRRRERRVDRGSRSHADARS